MGQEKQFLEVVGLIQGARSNSYKAVNAELINNYWQVGEYISKRIANSSWGDKTVDELAGFIEKNHPGLKGYNRSGLFRMRQFYEVYIGSAIVAPLGRQLQDIDNQKIIFVSPGVAQLEISDIRQSILAKITWTNHRIIIGIALGKYGDKWDNNNTESAER